MHPVLLLPPSSFLPPSSSSSIKQFINQSININQYQSISIKHIKYKYQSISINQYQSNMNQINIKQYQSISINTSNININQYQSISININQYISINEYQSISINQYQSININIIKINILNPIIFTRKCIHFALHTEVIFNVISAIPPNPSPPKTHETYHFHKEIHTFCSPY